MIKLSALKGRVSVVMNFIHKIVTYLRANIELNCKTLQKDVDLIRISSFTYCRPARIPGFVSSPFQIDHALSLSDCVPVWFDCQPFHIGVLSCPPNGFRSRKAVIKTNKTIQFQALSKYEQQEFGTKRLPASCKTTNLEPATSIQACSSSRELHLPRLMSSSCQIAVGYVTQPMCADLKFLRLHNRFTPCYRCAPFCQFTDLVLVQCPFLVSLPTYSAARIAYHHLETDCSA